MRLPLLLVVLLFAACSDAPENGGALDLAGGPVLPDTQTIDGVLVMRHGADAFARAPVWTLDSVPEVVIDGGEEFDLTHVRTAVPLRAGGWVAINPIGGGGARMMLFDETGRPRRLLAGPGPGPGELVASRDPIVLEHDTILVADGAKRALNRYTVAEGLVGTRRLITGFDPLCYTPVGMTVESRLVAMDGCLGGSRPMEVGRTLTPIVTFDLDFGDVDTVATVSGFEMARFQGEVRGAPAGFPVLVRFGRRPHLAVWGSHLVVATGESGYRLDLMGTDGVINGRIDVTVPRRAVTKGMVEASIEEAIARISGPGSEGAAMPDRVRAIEEGTPSADSLPPYGAIIAGNDGLLWVVNAQAPGDSTWSATAFRQDGAIVGRITSHRMGFPLWFDDGTAMVREVDEDGVVRFGVYAIVKARPALARSASGEGKG